MPGGLATVALDALDAPVVVDGAALGLADGAWLDTSDAGGDALELGAGPSSEASAVVKCDQRYSRIVSPDLWMSFANSGPTYR